MNTVRAFGKLVDPVDYRRGYGLLGWVVWLINGIRTSIERWIVFQILKLEARRSGMSRAEARQLIREAKKDPTIKPWLGETTKMPRLFERLMEKPVFQSMEDRAQARYGEGRKNREARPKALPDSELNTTLSVSRRKSDRSARYYLGRAHYLSYESGDE